jgi:hypothetical protein
MKKNQQETHIDKVDLSDSLFNHPAVHWISDNGKQLLWILAAAILLFLLFYRFFGVGSPSEKDFLIAENDFITFKKSALEKPNAEQQQAAFDHLTALLKKYPELHAKYDGPMAQILLEQGKVQEAAPFITNTLQRTLPDNLTYFTQYSRTTMTIENQDYKKALDEAQDLTQKLIDSSNASNKKVDEILYAYNLLRIAFLSQQVGDMGREMATWHAFMNTQPKAESNVSIQPVDQGVRDLVIQPFTEGKISLLDYIQQRKKFLKATVK